MKKIIMVITENHKVIDVIMVRTKYSRENIIEEINKAKSMLITSQSCDKCSFTSMINATECIDCLKKATSWDKIFKVLEKKSIFQAIHDDKILIYNNIEVDI